MNIHSPAFIKFAMVEAERWLEIIIDWLAMSAHMHIVYYENLILDIRRYKTIRGLFSDRFFISTNIVIEIEIILISKCRT